MERSHRSKAASLGRRWALGFGAWPDNAGERLQEGGGDGDLRLQPTLAHLRF